jgi:D-alanyl-D-alanine carboxypeptidase
LRKYGLLLASVSLAVLLASGAALAVTPVVGDDSAGKTDTEATAAANGPDAALDRALKELVAMRGGPPGVIAVVQRDEERVVHAFGVGNLQTGRPMRVDDRMRIASAAKAFSGAVALSLVSKGALSVNDTIGELLPELPDEWSEVTLGQLLNHTSGIRDFSQEPDFQDAVRASPTKAPPPEKLLSYIENKRLRFTPGTKYRYSNSDNIVVALMVEAATGRTYEGQLQEQVSGPLGLGRTSLPRGTNLVPPFIHGYDVSPPPPEDVSKVIAAGWAWASGGIVSTPGELNTFIRAYSKGELFDRRTRAYQRRLMEGGRSEPPGPGANSAGHAIFRYDTACGTMWGHTGNTLGYTQFMAATASGERSVVVSINAQLTPTVGDPDAFKALRHAEGRAVCAALAENS